MNKFTPKKLLVCSLLNSEVRPQTRTLVSVRHIYLEINSDISNRTPVVL